MPVLFVLCDRDAEPERTQRLADAIKEYGDSLSLSEYSHIIKTDRHADDLYAHLRQEIDADKNGGLWVFTVPEPYTGHAPVSVKEWLERIGEDTARRRADLGK